MLKNIVYVKPLENYRLFLRFEDGVEGEVDLANSIRFDGVFELLKAHNYFIKVFVNSEIGTICWPNGADLDPDVLYSVLSGQPLPMFTDPMPASMD